MNIRKNKNETMWLMLYPRKAGTLGSKINERQRFPSGQEAQREDI